MLRIHLFGKPEIFDPQGRPVALATRKVEQLLAYLWLHRDQPQARERLAGLFWSESSEEKSRLSLRHALHDLHKALGSFESCKGEILLLNRTSAQFNPKAPCWVDAHEFEQRINGAEDCKGDERIRLLREAVALYRGDFLEGCYDDWCLEERDYLKNLYLKALQELVVHHAELKEYEQAISHAKLILSENPLQEEIHRQLMYLYHAIGDRNAALQQYRTCERVLKDELGVEPLPETQDLFREIEEQASAARFRELARRRRELIQRYPELGAPFVGRESECEHLTLAWEAAVRGEGQAFFMGGEAGVGKTRLAQEFIQYVTGQGSLSLAGRCYEVEGRLPYQPWIEILRQAFSQAPLDVVNSISPVWLSEAMKLIPELMARFPDVKPSAPLLSPEQERNRLFEALSQVFVAISQEKPLVLVLDDLQWAADATLQYVHYFMRKLSKEKILLLGLYRAEEVDEGHLLWELIHGPLQEESVGTLELKTFSDEEVGQLVSGMLKVDAGPRELAQQLHKRSQGNAFFALELMKSLIESGTLYLDQEGAWQIEPEKLGAEHVPQTVKAVVLTRLRRLRRSSRDLLDLVSTRTRAFDTGFLEEAVGRRKEDLIASLEELLKTHFMVEKESHYEFRHDLIREVIYEGLLPERRRQLHLKVGNALERLLLHSSDMEAFLGEMAHHFYEAGEWSKALDYSLLAGRRVWSKSYAKEEALHFYRRALELAERLDDEQRRMKVYKGLGEVCCFTDKHDEGLQYSMKALELCKDPEERADIYCAIANVYHYKREFETALSYCNKALEELGPKRESLAAVKIYDAAGSCLNWLLRYDEAIRYCNHALVILERTPNDALKALILSTLGHAHTGKGDYDKAVEHLAKAASLTETTNDSHSIGSTFFSLGVAYYNGGQVDRAIEAWNRSLQANERLANLTHITVIYNRLTYAYMRKGELDQALHYADKQLESSTLIADSHYIANSYGMLGCIYDYKSSRKQAEQFFSQALDLAHEDGSMYQTIILSYLCLNEVDKAIRWLERGLPYLKERHIEYLKSGPAYTPAFDLLRQDARFKAWVYGKADSAS